MAIYINNGDERNEEEPLSSSTTTALGAPQSGHLGHEGQLHAGQATVTGAALAGAADVTGAEAGVADIYMNVIVSTLSLRHKKIHISIQLS